MEEIIIRYLIRNNTQTVLYPIIQGISLYQITVISKGACIRSSHIMMKRMKIMVYEKSLLCIQIKLFSQLPQ